jgi:hypothetical protein
MQTVSLLFLNPRHRASPGWEAPSTPCFGGCRARRFTLRTMMTVTNAGVVYQPGKLLDPSKLMDELSNSPLATPCVPPWGRHRLSLELPDPLPEEPFPATAQVTQGALSVTGLQDARAWTFAPTQFQVGTRSAL